MRRRPPPTAATDPADPTTAGTVGARRRTATLLLTLLAGVSLLALAVPAAAQTRAPDTPETRDALRRQPARLTAPTARSATTRSTTMRAPASPLRGSLESASSDILPADPSTRPVTDPGFADRTLDPDPLADGAAPSVTLQRTGLPAQGTPLAPGARPATTGTTPRIDPATGRPILLGGAADRDARRGPVGPVAATGSVRDGGPSRALPATQPTPRDIRADLREEAAIEDDAYAQLGLRTGGFTWLPAIETSAGWNSNIASKAGGAAGATWRVAPELRGRSDWSQHALEFELRGAYLGNAKDHDYDKPSFQGQVRGRVDLGDETRLDLRAGYSNDRQSPSSVDNPADTAVPATIETKTASLGLTRDVGLLAVTLRGDIERADYSGGTTTSGGSLGSDVQNNTRHIAALRAAWGSKGSIRPFVEVQVSNRDYDQALVSGSPRDSTGAALKGGVIADLGPTLRGELSTGWGIERPNQGTLPDITGWLLDGSLVWSPSRLTTVKLDTKTSFDPTTLAASTGAVTRTVGVTVDRALRPDLVASAGVSLTDKRYAGVKLREDTLGLSSGLTYKFNRNVQTFVKGTVERFTTSAANADYNAATVMVGVRLQR